MSKRLTPFSGLSFDVPTAINFAEHVLYEEYQKIIKICFSRNKARGYRYAFRRILGNDPHINKSRKKGISLNELVEELKYYSNDYFEWGKRKSGIKKICDYFINLQLIDPLLDTKDPKNPIYIISEQIIKQKRFYNILKDYFIPSN